MLTNVRQDGHHTFLRGCRPSEFALADPLNVCSRTVYRPHRMRPSDDLHFHLPSHPVDASFILEERVRRIVEPVEVEEFWQREAAVERGFDEYHSEPK